MDRKHFYPMMTPQPADFDKLQDNSEKAINSLASGLGGGSILEGLSVSLQPSTLLVSAGKAIDEQGRLLTLEKQTSITLGGSYLGLRYKQETTSATVWTGETYWQEKIDQCELYWSATPPAVCLGQRLPDGTFSLDKRSLRHSDRLDNPHNVTADQISTSSSLTDTNGLRKKWNIQQWLTHLLDWTKSYKKHAEDKENPHKVTANQITTSTNLTDTTGKKQTWSLQSWITYLLDIVVDGKLTLPVGYVYWQLPGKDSPSELGLPGNWEKISEQFAGCFFRAEGDDAADFSMDSIPEPQNYATAVGGLNIESSGEHGHTTSWNGAHRHTFRSVDRSGGYGAPYESGWNSHSDGGNFSSSTAGGHRHTCEPAGKHRHNITSKENETRPINHTIRLWERTS